MTPIPSVRGLRGPSLAVALVLAAAACKGETTYKDTPETVTKLGNLQKSITEKDKLIGDLEARVASLERGGGGVPGEIVLTIEGDALKIVAGGRGGKPMLDDAASMALGQKFLDILQRSRGAIQKCYEGALKKNNALQGRTISLKITASFAASGAFQSVSFNGLGDPFDPCLRAVAAKWTLPAGAAPQRVQGSVSLTPT